MFFLLIVGAFIISALASMYYLATRFRKFLPEKTREKLGKKKSLLIGAIPDVGLIVYCVFDLVNGVIVTVNVAVIFIIFELVGKLIKLIINKIKKKSVDENASEEIKPFYEKIYLTGICAIIFSAVYLSIGWYLAHNVWETDYSIQTTKDIGMDRLRIAQISDSHIGATFDGDGFAKHMETIQKTNPDVVVVTGDFVDDSSKKEDFVKSVEALGRMKTTYGVYFIYGNHDKGFYNTRDFDDKDIRETLAKNNVKLLEDSYEMLGNNVYLIGRKDKSDSKRGDTRLEMDELTKDLDDSKYQIVLDHQPNDYDAQEAAGVDLVLSGHTHGGQMIPVGGLGVLTGVNDKTYGLERRGNTDFIVNSGISDWAIGFKTGTKSEFGIIDITSVK
ncbi:MAG: metallophosphoesterase [Eubacterium sp.]|nr:metallophosphoesterase [Eubacterium sp.]